MDTSRAQPPLAWEPLTPRGVAAFACASLRRLLLVQLFVAVLATATLVWFLATAWFPTITTAIERLPRTGEIRSGRLVWRGDSPRTLAENRFLALTVDLRHDASARSSAHIQAEFGESDLRIFSLLGFLPANYPRGWIIAFNRVDLQPWWGAWAPEILAVAGGIAIAGLMMSWCLLAVIYCPVVWLIGFFANRELTLGGSWRVAGAALLPGAVFMTLSIFLYGLGALDLVRLLSAAALHLVIGWVYLVASPLWLPRHPETPLVKNPFRTRS